MNTETAEKIAKAIEASKEDTPTTVSLKTGIPRTTLNRKLVGGADFGVYEVARIAMALGRDPADFLPQEYRTLAKTG